LLYQKAWLIKNFPKHFIKGHWHKTPGFPGREDDEVIFDAISENVIMAATKKSTTGSRSKTGPKDKSYVNKKQSHEVDYDPKRKTPPKKFGEK
jgi:hypothetical protein